VGIAAPVPSWAKVVTAADRPDLWSAAAADPRFAALWPEYNHHGNHAGSYFGALFPEDADVQLLVVDADRDEVVARGRTIPFPWDGTLEDLPGGIDAVGRRALDDAKPPTALSALAAEVLPEHQGTGLSGVVIRAMAEAARARRLAPLVAPVRPNRKDRYPLIGIERYAHWRRADGLPFDPWIRVHVRLGGSILRPEPLSMEITHPVDRWEAWTGMAFPEDGSYVFPGGLAPLSVTDGVGHYWEPNVWMRHEV
jgi:GNAT superfamily N-acetyltransferase